MRMRETCAGLPRVCPGLCNPRNRQRHCSGEKHQQQQHQQHQQRVVNRNLIYNPEFALFSRRTQPEPACSRPCSPGLSPEEREFVNSVAHRIHERRRTRGKDSRRIKRLVAFVMFFMLHGLVALWTKNYQQYQTFLATQFCGFITIMFWDDKSS